MSSLKRILAVGMVAGLMLPVAVFAAQKSYQVTGQVVEATDTTITVDKAGEKFEITRTPSTKVDGDLKVGAKVTVQYTMTATEVEVKGAKEKAPKKK